MKRLALVVLFILSFVLSACTTQVDVTCGEGTVAFEGQCIPKDSVVCDDGYHNEEGQCIEDELTCDSGYIVEEGQCVVDEEEEDLSCNPGYHEEAGTCVPNQVLETPDWFDGWTMLQEPSGNKSLSDYTFTENGFSVNLSADQRTGIQLSNVSFVPGYAYEVRFNYSSSTPGRLLYVQLQGHDGNVFTNPAIVMSDSVEQFSQALAYPPTANPQSNGWLTIELLPGGQTSTITITDIEVITTALPECGENEELDGFECIPTNNGFTPNGTPTAWFDGWQILTIPSGNKEIEDLHFTENGYTVYLGDGDRSGIEYMTYAFESGYTYEIQFDYTASVAGRMVWVQMEAFGGYGFTNTETFTIVGTATFSQTLEIPSTYTPVEPGWIKLELTPGAQDNVTIENIVIIKTPIT